MTHIPLEEAERRSRPARQRPSVEGSRQAWIHHEGPIHAPSLAGKPIPPREWAVEDLVPLRAVTLFSGDGGSGKSTLALQLAVSSVLGKPWLGRRTAHGKVCYVSCEDDLDELHRRLAGICDSEGWDLADTDGLELFDRVGRDSAVMHRGQGFGAWDDGPWWIGFSNWVTDFGPGLVILDSLYDFFTGNQLDQASARLFMGKLRQLAHDAGCAIIVLWHPSKSGMENGDGTSGNVAFRNAARAMLYLDRVKDEGQDDERILRGKKANYGPLANEIPLRWESGRFVPATPQGTPTGAFAGMHMRNAERAFVDALNSALNEGHEPSFSIEARSHYAPRLFHGRPETKGFSPSDLEKAMKSLMNKGDIILGTTAGPKSRQKKIIIPKGHPLSPSLGGCEPFGQGS